MLYPLQAQRSPVSGWILASSTTANVAQNRGFEPQATKVLAQSWVLSSFRSDIWQKEGALVLGRLVQARGLGAEEALGWAVGTRTVLAAPA